jgi:hypothetical protein
MAAPGYLARPSGRAPAADGLPVAVDPSTASFRALALQVRAMGLLDRRPGYYRVKITLTILAFSAGWALVVVVGNSWATLAVAALAGSSSPNLASSAMMRGTTRCSAHAGAIACSASP